MHGEAVQRSREIDASVCVKFLECENGYSEVSVWGASRLASPLKSLCVLASFSEASFDNAKP